ncbi:MAG: hypothetical protein PHV74_10495 [Dehalococcoidia bacterium]|nr:hypothetical protein [Dehalococcoidia bacterium]
MAEKIKYSVNVQVVGGTSIPITGEITPEAYAKIQIIVAAGAADVPVNLQPSGANLAEFLLIKSSAYDDALTYKVNDATATAISLDAPHIFIGKGAVAILDASPTQLLFSNGLTSDVTIDILIGRDATP